MDRSYNIREFMREFMNSDIIIRAGGIAMEYENKEKELEEQTEERVKRKFNKKHSYILIGVTILLTIVFISISTIMQPEKDISKLDVTVGNLTPLVKDVLDEDELIKVNVDVDKVEEGFIVDIFYDSGIRDNGKALIRDTVMGALDSYELLYKNDDISEVWFWSKTDGVHTVENGSDTFMKIALKKGRADVIDWDKLRDSVEADYNVLFDISDDYHIPLNIAKGLEEDDLE